MSRFIATILLAAATASPTFAGFIQEFQTDVGAPIGNTFTSTATGLSDNGVTFDATLTVTGSGTALDVISTAIGVVGLGSDLVNDGEFLSFTVAVSNVSGGTVSIDGFTELDFNFLGTTDTAFLSLDNSSATAADNFFVLTSGADVFDISSVSPASFFAIAGDSTTAGVENSFRINDVSASFTGTAAAVPEPSAFALLGLAIAGTILVRKRRKNSLSNIATE